MPGRYLRRDAPEFQMVNENAGEQGNTCYPTHNQTDTKQKRKAILTGECEVQLNSGVLTGDSCYQQTGHERQDHFETGSQHLRNSQMIHTQHQQNY